uniref:Uncharacterized protein n=1 Tax=Rhizophora mucronata TaxID=61149 RepID=A0A2P2Q206_RHIMU
MVANLSALDYNDLLLEIFVRMNYIFILTTKH